MIQPEWYNGLVAFFLPVLIEYLKNQSWKRIYKFIFAFVITLIISILSVFLQGKLDFMNIFDTLVLIFSISQFVYNTFWKSIFEKD